MKKLKNRNLWFIAGLLGIGCILFWRCFYSVNTTDEAYYVGTVFRLWKGDGMLCDEWNPTQQLSSFWLYPFYCLFRLILGSNGGMILAFRLLYIVFQLGISGYLYRKLKDYGWAGMGAVFFYLLSTAFNINSLSYNTMANSALLVTLVTLVCMKKINWRDCIIAGVFASIAVMANPYAVIVYILYVAGTLLAGLRKKKDCQKIQPGFQISAMIRISITALAVLCVFVLFTLKNATLEEIWKNLPYILGDEEHQQRWNVKFSDYLRYFQKYYYWSAFGNLSLVLMAIFDKQRIRHRKWWVLAAFLVTMPDMIYHGWRSDYVPINLVTVPICFMGAVIYMVLEKKPKTIFYFWYLPGMLYPLLVQIASNTGPLAVSAAFMTAGSAAVLFLGICSYEMLEKKGSLEKLMSVAVIGAVIFQLATMLVLRITYVWADADMASLDTRVTRGPAKGLYTTAESVEYYDQIFDDLDSLEMTEEDGFLVVGADPMLYLYADREVASYSTWRVFTNETRLYRYYEIHEGEGKFPTVVYCVNADDSIYDSIFVEKMLMPMGYESKVLSQGIAFYTPRE